MEISSASSITNKDETKADEVVNTQSNLSVASSDLVNTKDRKDVDETEKSLSEAGRAPSISQFEEDFRTITPSRKFEWPEGREKTEEQIQQLKEKQILFIIGCTSIWWNWAPTRFASVLHSSLNKLWAGCDGAKESLSEKSQSTSFGFWKKYPKQPRPVIVCVSTINSDAYLQTLLQVGWDTASYIIDELKARNIYLLIPTKDKVLFQKLLDKDKRESFSELLYSYWQVPAVQLELNKYKKETADDICYEIHTRLKNANLSEQIIYYIIHENQSLPDEELLKLIEEEGRMDNREFALLDSALEDETELKIRILYAVTFFHETSMADFEFILSVLLRNKTISKKNPDNTYEDLPLYQTWLNPIRQIKIMKDCLLTVREITNTSVISFSEKIDYQEIKSAFLHKSFYPIFFSITKELLESNLLFTNLSRGLYPSLIKLFSILIKTNSVTYDGKWLFARAITQAKKLYRNVSEQEFEDIERLLDIDLLKKALEPLNGLLKELLLLNQEQLKDNVSQFFRSMIGSSLKKDVVLELAIDLYTDLQNTENFPEKELDNYFIQSLEDSVKDDFTTYFTLIKYFQPITLYQKTSSWLLDEVSKEYSNTRRFAWLYKVDYCIVTFYHHYFSKESARYEFLNTADKKELIPAFTSYTKDLLSLECLKSLEILLSENNGFVRRLNLLEMSLTDVFLYLNVRDIKSISPLTLVGEILFNWYYILAENFTKDESTFELIRDYTVMLTNQVDVKQLSEIRIFWRTKANKIYTDNILSYKQLPYTDENNMTIEILKKRRHALESLLTLTSSTK